MGLGTKPSLTLKDAEAIQKNARGIMAVAPYSSGTAQLGKALFSIPAKSQEKMNFVVERGAFGQSEAEAKAFDMTLNFEFNS